MPFETKEDVMNYVIDHQLARRNLSDLEKSYLRGKRYLTEKKASHRPNTSELHQDDGVIGETAQKIAKLHGVSQATIERDAGLAEAIDKLKEEVGDDFSKNLRSGKVKISKKDTIELSKKPPEYLKALAEQIEKSAKLSEAEKIVQSQNVSSSDQSHETTPLPKNNEILVKVERHLSQALKFLEKAETAKQPDKLVELSAMVQKISDRLKVIGEISPNPVSQNVDNASENPHKAINDDSCDENSDSLSPEEYELEAASADDGAEFAEDNPSNSMDCSIDLPEGYEFYEEAMKSENENQGEW
jgi:hypothetical protein